ncbi:hypothetical protein AB1L30_18550 [Bremerella sp. JC817]|uniref:hypothetical protein n=1 Tax=Bremerella sp. JC817 TaxID=3231756 RepID=UPI00345763C4
MPLDSSAPKGNTTYQSIIGQTIAQRGGWEVVTFFSLVASLGMLLFAGYHLWTQPALKVDQRIALHLGIALLIIYSLYLVATLRRSPTRPITKVAMEFIPTLITAWPSSRKRRQAGR